MRGLAGLREQVAQVQGLSLLVIKLPAGMDPADCPSETPWGVQLLSRVDNLGCSAGRCRNPKRSGSGKRLSLGWWLRGQVGGEVASLCSMIRAIWFSRWPFVVGNTA